MEEQLISFETAKLAKEKGFDQFYCCSHYNRNDVLITDTEGYPNGSRWIKYMQDCISAPTQALLQKWLYSKYNMWIRVEHDCGNTWFYVIQSCKYDSTGFMFPVTIGTNPLPCGQYLDPYIALEAALSHALTLIPTSENA